MKKETREQLELLLHNRIAHESIEYYYDKEPKYTHRMIINDPYCFPRKIKQKNRKLRWYL